MRKAHQRVFQAQPSAIHQPRTPPCPRNGGPETMRRKNASPHSCTCSSDLHSGLAIPAEGNLSCIHIGANNICRYHIWIRLVNYLHLRLHLHHANCINRNRS